MGCDIHLFTERKQIILNQEKWINVDNWKLNPYYVKGNEDGEDPYKINPAYKSRNYTLFSILADVRNYAGNVPIHSIKGLPIDVSDIVKAENDRWGSDGHSHSFFTMKELYDYFEQNQTVQYSGFVDPDGAKAIEAGNMPNWWCQDSNIKTLVWKEWEYKNEDFQYFIETLEAHFKSEYYAKERDSENFRIIFWFDN